MLTTNDTIDSMMVEWYSDSDLQINNSLMEETSGQAMFSVAHSLAVLRGCLAMFLMYDILLYYS